MYALWPTSELVGSNEYRAISNLYVSHNYGGKFTICQ